MPGRTLSVWVIAGAAAFLLMVWAQSAVKLNGRRRELAALAERWGMMPLERDMLPAEMTLNGTKLQRWVRIVNVYVGAIGGAEVAFFDCSSDIGSARWSRTVIARRSESVAGLLGAIGGEYVVERAGEWQAVFRPRLGFNINRPFMPVQQIESTLSNLSKLGEP
jgi:hypothetical protein